MELMLTPYPASVREMEGICRGRLCPAFETEGSPLLETAAKMLENARTPGAGRDIPVALASAPGADPEGYLLSISGDSVTVAASAPAGWFYGVVTLCQLVRQFGGELPCLEIADQPKWRHRGAQVSYAQMNVAYRPEYLKRFLDKMAMLKINHVYLYLEWRFQFPSIPATHMEGYMTPEDAREMIRYAAARNITLVPGLNVMGHSSDLLGAEIFEELKEYDAGNQDAMVGGSSALCPSSPKTRALVEKALTDILDIFDSPVIHVGGDEVGELGICPLCAERKKEIGTAGIYLDYFCWIRDILKKRGRKMGIWCDMMAQYAGLNPYYPPKEDIIPTERFLELRDSTIIYDWSYDGPAKESIDSFAQNGFEVICSTSVHGCSTATPWLGQIKNQYDYFKDGFQPGVLGGLATDWVYGLGYHGEEMGALYAAAEAMMWQGTADGFAAGTSREQFEKVAALQYYGAGPALAAVWHQAGDPDKGVLQFFPGQKNGSYLRKIAYLSDNPLLFYCKYSPYLRGREEEFHKEVEELGKLWTEAKNSVRPEEAEWIGFCGCSAVLLRYLEGKYFLADRFHSLYRKAAQAQYENPEEFSSLLEQAAASLESWGTLTDEPAAFLKACAEKLGLETGSIRRLENMRRNLEKLAAFTRSLRDSRRPLPSIQNISLWLFERTGTGFWNPRSDEWYRETEEFCQPETDMGAEWGSARW